ncbi:MAG: transcription elongation factor GreA [Syntrophorhabdaceae bacterium]|nr:transcription elongation factor GreA [Syntrophorhabdaceae bacterium]MDD4196564.1 transcription elongation factor GreA [Syntrophorhabdaceae bacterium]
MKVKAPITREGYEALKKEHETMLGVKRPQILKAIEEAREHGDLSENAEYDAAREEFQFLQQRVAEIEEQLRNSEIVDKKTFNGETVEFGCTVHLVNLDTDEESLYRIVGPYESDIKRNTISITSPLGRALMGKCVGDEVNFNAPGGKRTYEIVRVD